MNVAEMTRYLTEFIYRPDLSLFPGDSSQTAVECVPIDGRRVPRYVNEFWTAKQRQASSIHEISYRACFKPQLPRFFTELLTKPGDVVYDPFSGRGTTVIEAGLLGRRIISNDVNPLSGILTRPRFFVPRLADVEQRLTQIPIKEKAKADIDLSMFYHPRTEAEIVSLRQYLADRKASGEEDDLDRWIRMVATNRLTGHSSGFFSVYTLPPNQATTPQRQIKINERRSQVPPLRDTRRIILRKSKSLVRSLTDHQREDLKRAGKASLFLAQDARHTAQIEPGSVQLTVTSPPFLDVVQYAADNWLRCWFNGIELDAVSEKMTVARSIKVWSCVMGDVFGELFRITAAGGHVAFEVGEVKRGTVKLEDYVLPLGLKAGFACEAVLINLQDFTKTSNIWGINNGRCGTNTNRIALFRKEQGPG